ncbi:MAG: aminotransferase class V-fold PLP-dependent enzyme [Thermomicrobiaceae bacterium]
MIYLDNAATSWPKPEQVYETLGSFLKHSGANPGRSSHRMATSAAGTIDRTRNRIAALFNAQAAERVIFTANATDALNLAIKGVLNASDHAISTVMEHNSVRRPLRALEERGVVTTRVSASPEGVVSVDNVREALRPNTQLIAITHASNVNGALQPIADIAEIAREHGAFLLVDAAQTAGTIPIDMAELGVDLLAIPGHKALMGPPGTGALMLGDRIDLDDLSTIREGGTGGNSEEDVQPRELPARYEAGTQNTVGIAALGAALNFLSDAGFEEAGKHELEMTWRLIEGLSGQTGVTILNPAEPSAHVSVVSIIVDSWEPSEFGTTLDSAFEIACRTGLHCAPEACQALGAFPGGTVRLSPGYWTTPDEIDQTISAIRELASAPLKMSS